MFNESMFSKRMFEKSIFEKSIFEKSKYSLIMILLFVVVGCSEGKYGGLSDAELREKKRHCDSIPKKSPVFATGCENIKKEIERRRKEKRKK